ncbi:MAG TPA: SRPBCC family protein [Acidimicrobiales bacterium]|nr:SRPBCC family protein [Acidimicrobiales bacterium]
MSSPYVIDYVGEFLFDVPPVRLWSALEEMDGVERWWAWLSEFSVEGGGLRQGTVLRGVVRPPLPYRMALVVELDECEAPSLIEASVHGDLEGRAGLLLDDEGGATRATVAWTIEMTQQPMRVAARLAHPLMRWGHDRVVEATVRGFRRRLASRP